MARKRMVTRTIVGTKAVALCLDTDTAEPCNKEIILSGEFADEKALLKAAKRAIETDNFKVAKIVSTELITKMYKMDEQKFISLADEVIEK